MRHSFSTIVVAGFLMLSACIQMPARAVGPPPGGPNDPVPPEYLRGTEFDAPNMMRYSWGMELAPQGSEDPNVDYPWSEVRQRLAARYR